MMSLSDTRRPTSRATDEPQDRHGGVFPVKVLRLFRHGRGRCENRWMDEHIKVAGTTVDFAGELIDDNLNTLTWWTNKHNWYVSREAVDLLNLEYRFMPHDSAASRQAFAYSPTSSTATSSGWAFSTARQAPHFTSCRGSGTGTWSTRRSRR